MLAYLVILRMCHIIKSAGRRNEGRAVMLQLDRPLFKPHKQGRNQRLAYVQQLTNFPATFSQEISL